MSKPKIFVFCNNGSPRWHVFEALTEDGCFIASHVCSEPCFALGDMGLTTKSKHKTYDRHYPDGWELELVLDPANHTALDAAHRRHVAWDDEAYKKRMAVHQDGGDHVSVKIEFAEEPAP